MVEVIRMWCCLRATSVPLLLLPYFRPLVFSLALHETVTYLAAKVTLLLKVWPTDQVHQLTQQSVRHADPEPHRSLLYILTSSSGNPHSKV